MDPREIALGFSGASLETRRAQSRIAFVLVALSPSPYLHAMAASLSSAPPSLQILYNGKNVAGNRTPTKVVAGEQIVLTAGNVPNSAAAKQWTLGGYTVGGYSATKSTPTIGKILPITLNEPSVQFYWYQAGTATATFSYKQKDGRMVSSSANFSIEGPPLQIIRSRLGTLTIINNDTLSFGVNFGDRSGITFELPPPTNMNKMGKFSWVQLIESDTITFSNDVGVLNCVGGTGLDNSYPYPEGHDSPGLMLPEEDTGASRNFQASMYLMWTPNSKKSIPIPLGFTDWGFVASTSRLFVSQNWQNPPLGQPIEPISSAIPLYPEWSKIAKNHDLKCTGG